MRLAGSPNDASCSGRWPSGSVRRWRCGIPQLLGIDFVFIPGLRGALHLPAWIYLPLAVLAIVGSSHAVNLTDGLDSLAGWTALDRVRGVRRDRVPVRAISIW